MSNTTQSQGDQRLKIDYLATSSLSPMPGAPREHPKSQIRLLEKSIHAFNFNVPVLIDRHNRLIAGHARVQAAKNLGLSEIPVIRIEDLSEAQVKGLLLADNQIASLAKSNDKAEAQLLLELSQIELTFDLEATGFYLAEIELKIAGIDDPTPGTDEEPQILVAAGPAITRLGDHWCLGSHTLLCGDARREENWRILMEGGPADLVVTDPPYNVPIAGHVSGLGKHKHREVACAVGEMTPDQFIALLKTVMALAQYWSKPGSVHYWAMDWRHQLEICTAGFAVFERFLNMAVWVKNQPGMGSFYRSQHELFFIFAKGGATPRNNIQLGRFGRSRSNVWTYPSAASLARTAEEGNPLAMHPTVKPLALIADILLDASIRGEIVADPFAGSGTTLIAAEKLGRRARCMELDPAYCDTIIRRWQHWTGEAAVRIADGMSFNALSAKPVRGDQ
jgi:DNA modification methylase